MAKSEVFLVKTAEENILDIKSLVKATCNPEYTPPSTDYQVIKQITSLDKYKKYTKSIEIKNTIFEKFFSGIRVSLKDLRPELKKYKVSNPSLCNYLSHVRKDLEKKGFKIIKQGSSYQLIKSN